MRHTRNRQLIKATGQTGWKEARVLTIEYMRKAVPDLDTTFKWHRVFNQVSYQEPYKGLDSYVVVRLYSNRTQRIVKY